MRSSPSPAALVAAVTSLGLAAAAGPALAAPVVDGEFALPGTPGQLTLGPDGDIWIVLRDGDYDIAKVSPTGVVERYRDAKLDGAIGIVSGPDRRLWLTAPGRFVSFSPADPQGSATEVPAPAIGVPNRVIVDDAGVLWTASGENVVSTTTAGVVRSFRVAGMSARGIAFGGDRQLWVADFGNGQLIAVTRDGTASTPTAVGGGPQEVAAGPGTQIAYTNQGIVPHEIGRVDQPGTALRSMVAETDPFGITYAPDQAYWIANFNSHDLTRLSTTGEVTKLGGFSPLSGPRWVTVGNGGTLWVSLEVARRVARVTGVEAPRVDPPRTEPPRTNPPRTEPPRTADRTKPRVTLKVSGRPRAGARAVVVTASVSEASTLTATLRQRVAGKRRGSACVKPTRKLRRARSCVRLIVLGSARATAKDAGSVRLMLRRRDRRALAAGSYRIDVSARDSAGNRTTKTLALLLRRPRR